MLYSCFEAWNNILETGYSMEIKTPSSRPHDFTDKAWCCDLLASLCIIHLYSELEKQPTQTKLQVILKTP